MTNEKLALEIAKGLVGTGVEGAYDALTCSTAGDYPSMGCSQWEGISGRGDNLLSYIDGGEKFMGRFFSDIENSGEFNELSSLLGSEQGQEAQNMILSSDCLDSYIPALQEVPDFTNPLCIIYAGIWCPTSHYVVKRFLINRADRVDLNDLGELHNVFFNEYATAAGCGEYSDGYENRANTTFEYVSNLSL